MGNDRCSSDKTVNSVYTNKDVPVVVHNPNKRATNGYSPIIMFLLKTVTATQNVCHG